MILFLSRLGAYGEAPLDVKPHLQVSRASFGTASWPWAMLLAALVCAMTPVGNNRAHAGETTTILAFGDSLTAGYGLAPQQGFTAQLEEALVRQGINANVINAGVSGDTTSGGRARLAWVLDAQKQPLDLIILELGANDALRGIDPATARANLDAMLTTLAKRNIPVLVAGMRAPPNWGPDYSAAFDTLYSELAAKHGVPLYPFFLDGVAAIDTYNQPDGIHPNSRGVGIIVDRITPFVVQALGREQKARK